MKITLSIIFAALVFGFRSFGQMGGASPGLDNSMELLFSGNPVFSATMQTDIASARGSMSVAAKMFFDHGNSRTEMNVAGMQGSAISPQAAAQMKAMGMDQIVTIAPSSKTNVYMIYPNLHSYLSVSVPPQSATNNTLQTTKLGAETVSGHPCVKNKNTVTVNGQPHDFTTWNATDLKNFPIQISLTDEGTTITMSFQNISFSTVSASEFQPPTGYTKYSSPQEMMQAVIMSHANAFPGASGGAGSPPPNQ